MLHQKISSVVESRTLIPLGDLADVDPVFPIGKLGELPNTHLSSRSSVFDLSSARARMSFGSLDLTSSLLGYHPQLPMQKIDIGRRWKVGVQELRFVTPLGVPRRDSITLAPVAGPLASEVVDKNVVQAMTLTRALFSEGAGNEAFTVSGRAAIPQLYAHGFNTERYCWRLASMYVTALWADMHNEPLSSLSSDLPAVRTVSTVTAFSGFLGTNTSQVVCLRYEGFADDVAAALPILALAAAAEPNWQCGVALPAVARTWPAMGATVVLYVGAQMSAAANVGAVTPQRVWDAAAMWASQHGVLGLLMSMIDDIGMLWLAPDRHGAVLYPAGGLEVPLAPSDMTGCALVPLSHQYVTSVGNTAPPYVDDAHRFFMDGALASMAWQLGYQHWMCCNGLPVMGVLPGTDGLVARLAAELRTRGSIVPSAQAASAIAQQLGMRGTPGLPIMGARGRWFNERGVAYHKEQVGLWLEWEELAPFTSTLHRTTHLSFLVEPMSASTLPRTNVWYEPTAVVGTGDALTAAVSMIVGAGAVLGVAAYDSVAGSVVTAPAPTHLTYRGRVSSWSLFDRHEDGRCTYALAVKFPDCDSALLAQHCTAAAAGVKWYVARPQSQDDFGMHSGPPFPALPGSASGPWGGVRHGWGGDPGSWPPPPHSYGGGDASGGQPSPAAPPMPRRGDVGPHDAGSNATDLEGADEHSGAAVDRVEAGMRADTADPAGEEPGPSHVTRRPPGDFAAEDTFVVHEGAGAGAGTVYYGVQDTAVEPQQVADAAEYDAANPVTALPVGLAKAMERLLGICGRMPEVGRLVNAVRGTMTAATGDPTVIGGAAMENAATQAHGYLAAIDLGAVLQTAPMARRAEALIALARICTEMIPSSHSPSAAKMWADEGVRLRTMANGIARCPAVTADELATLAIEAGGERMLMCTPRQLAMARENLTPAKVVKLLRAGRNALALAGMEMSDGTLQLAAADVKAADPGLEEPVLGLGAMDQETLAMLADMCRGLDDPRAMAIDLFPAAPPALIDEFLRDYVDGPGAVRPPSPGDVTGAGTVRAEDADTHVGNAAGTSVDVLRSCATPWRPRSKQASAAPSEADNLSFASSRSRISSGGAALSEWEVEAAADAVAVDAGFGDGGMATPSPQPLARPMPPHVGGSQGPSLADDIQAAGLIGPIADRLIAQLDQKAHEIRASRPAVPTLPTGVTAEERARGWRYVYNYTAAGDAKKVKEMLGMWDPNKHLGLFHPVERRMLTRGEVSQITWYKEELKKPKGLRDGERIKKLAPLVSANPSGLLVMSMASNPQLVCTRSQQRREMLQEIAAEMVGAEAGGPPLTRP
ncbi:capsid protein [Parry's Creek toti-like virus 1]|nr:capsid protein [Parry's Creek toti-like virus 1]